MIHKKVKRPLLIIRSVNVTIEILILSIIIIATIAEILIITVGKYSLR